LVRVNVSPHVVLGASPASLSAVESTVWVAAAGDGDVMAKRRWTINGRFLTQPVTGVQRYGREILRALDQHLAHDHPLSRDLELDVLVPGNCPLDVALSTIAVRTTMAGQGYIWEQAILPRNASAGILSLCNTGPILARRQIVCIHDANTRIVPQSYSWTFRWAYGVLLPVLGRTAKMTTTVSAFSAAQLEESGIAPRGRVEVVHDGHEHALRWVPRITPATKQVSSANTIVVIGSRAPHKNIGLLLGLAPQLAAEGLRLAIVGMENGRVFSGGGPAIDAENVVWLGRLTDGEIAEVLRQAMCLALPSLTEGFGLPAAEAMALGCPVAVSNCGSLPEICGEAALYAAPDDPDGWLHNFKRLRDEPALRQSLKRAGLPTVARYSWNRSAERYLELMARVDGVPATMPVDPVR
jgi:glycosyltransferase involved in cell wall biosynthesis